MKKWRNILIAMIAAFLMVAVPMVIVHTVVGILEREEARENAIWYEAYYQQMEQETPEGYVDSASIRNYEPQHGIK